MKIHVVKDTEGKVIATFEKPTGNSPSIEPELPHGHTVHEMDVAENYRDNIHAFYKQHGR